MQYHDSKTKTVPQAHHHALVFITYTNSGANEKELQRPKIPCQGGKDSS